jgi:hypothetical protein
MAVNTLTMEFDLKDLRLENVTSGDYRIIGDLIYVRGDVYLRRLNLKAIPWKFGRVSGWFDCAENQLQTLEGAPRSVGGVFFCNNNQLRTLKGAPDSVGDFICVDNPLISRAGWPKCIGKRFYV